MRFSFQNPINLHEATGKTSGSLEDQQAAMTAQQTLESEGGSVANAVLRLSQNVARALETRQSLILRILRLEDEGANIAAWAEAWNDLEKATKLAALFSAARDILQ